MFTEKYLILISFLSLQLIKDIYSFTCMQEGVLIRILRNASLLIYAILSFLTYKKNMIATTILAIIIALSGLGSLAAFFFVSYDQLTLKIVSIILGVFFTVCGTRLLIIGRN